MPESAKSKHLTPSSRLAVPLAQHLPESLAAFSPCVMVVDALGRKRAVDRQSTIGKNGPPQSGMQADQREQGRNMIGVVKTHIESPGDRRSAQSASAGIAQSTHSTTSTSEYTSLSTDRSPIPETPASPDLDQLNKLNPGGLMQVYKHPETLGRLKAAQAARAQENPGPINSSYVHPVSLGTPACLTIPRSVLHERGEEGFCPTIGEKKRMIEVFSTGEEDWMARMRLIDLRSWLEDSRDVKRAEEKNAGETKGKILAKRMVEPGRETEDGQPTKKLCVFRMITVHPSKHGSTNDTGRKPQQQGGTGSCPLPPPPTPAAAPLAAIPFAQTQARLAVARPSSSYLPRSASAETSSSPAFARTSPSLADVKALAPLTGKSIPPTSAYDHAATIPSPSTLPPVFPATVSPRTTVPALPGSATGIFSREGIPMVFKIMARTPSASSNEATDFDQGKLEETIRAHGGLVCPQVPSATHLIFPFAPSEPPITRLDQSAYKVFVQRVGPHAVLSYEYIRDSINLGELVPMNDYIIAAPVLSVAPRPSGIHALDQQQLSWSGSIRHRSTASSASGGSFIGNWTLNVARTEVIKQEDDDDDVVCLSPLVVRDPKTPPSVSTAIAEYTTTTARGRPSTVRPPASQSPVLTSNPASQPTAVNSIAPVDSTASAGHQNTVTPNPVTSLRSSQYGANQESEVPLHKVKTIRNSLAPGDLVPLGRNKRPKSPTPPSYRPGKRLDTASLPPIPVRPPLEAEDSDRTAGPGPRDRVSKCVPDHRRAVGTGRISAIESESLHDLVIVSAEGKGRHSNTHVRTTSGGSHKRADAIDSLFSGHASTTDVPPEVESRANSTYARKPVSTTGSNKKRRSGVNNRRLNDIRRVAPDGRRLLDCREFYDIQPNDLDDYASFVTYLAGSIDKQCYTSVPNALADWKQKDNRDWFFFRRKYKTRLHDDLPALEIWYPHPNPKRRLGASATAATNLELVSSDDSGSSSDSSTDLPADSPITVGTGVADHEGNTHHTASERQSLRIALGRQTRHDGYGSASMAFNAANQSSFRTRSTGHRSPRSSRGFQQSGWYAKHRYAPDGRKLLGPREHYDILAEDVEAVDAFKLYIRANQRGWDSLWKNIGAFRLNHNGTDFKGKSLFQKYRTRLYDDLPVLESLQPHPNPRRIQLRNARIVSEAGDDQIRQGQELAEREPVRASPVSGVVAEPPTNYQQGVMRDPPPFQEMLQAYEGGDREVSVTSAESDYEMTSDDEEDQSKAKYRCAPDGRRFTSRNEHWDVFPADQADYDVLVNHIRSNAESWSSLLPNIAVLNLTYPHRCFKALFYKYKTRLCDEVPVLARFTRLGPIFGSE